MEALKIVFALVGTILLVLASFTTAFQVGGDVSPIPVTVYRGVELNTEKDSVLQNDFYFMLTDEAEPTTFRVMIEGEGAQYVRTQAEFLTVNPDHNFVHVPILVKVSSNYSGANKFTFHISVARQDDISDNGTHANIVLRIGKLYEVTVADGLPQATITPTATQTPTVIRGVGETVVVLNPTEEPSLSVSPSAIATVYASGLTSAAAEPDGLAAAANSDWQTYLLAAVFVALAVFVVYNELKKKNKPVVDVLTGVKQNESIA